MRAYQRALKTAHRQGLRQGGEAGVKQAMRQGCVTPLTPGVTGPGRVSNINHKMQYIIHRERCDGGLPGSQRLR